MATVVSALSAISALRFDRTVSRELVHRRSMSEVFLADSRAVGDTGFVAGAQISALHARGANRPSDSTSDALVLLECCRQAETRAALEHFGVPGNARSVVQSWSFSLPGLADMRPMHGPADVVIMGDAQRARPAGQFGQALCYRMHVIESDTYVGEVRMDVAYVQGRTHAPAMALMDAGRRAALLAAKAAVPDAAAWSLTALDADFERYAEPGSPHSVVTHTPYKGVVGRDIRVPATFRQYGRVSARATLTLTRVPR